MLSRRVYVRVGLWTALGVVALVCILDHFGAFYRCAVLRAAGIDGYPGDDLRYSGRTFAFVGMDDRRTVRLEGPLGRFDVRLLGVLDASAEAAEHVSRRCAGREVFLRLDESCTRDEEGRLLGYVYVGDELLNLELISRGLAVTDVTSHALRGMFDQAERSAKKKRLGVWGGARTSAR